MLHPRRACVEGGPVPRAELHRGPVPLVRLRATECSARLDSTQCSARLDSTQCFGARCTSTASQCLSWAQARPSRRFLQCKVQNRQRSPSHSAICSCVCASGLMVSGLALQPSREVSDGIGQAAKVWTRTRLRRDRSSRLGVKASPWNRLVCGVTEGVDSESRPALRVDRRSQGQP